MPNPLSNQNMEIKRTTRRPFYWPVRYRFVLALGFAFIWMTFCSWISFPWVKDLASQIGFYPAWYIVIFVALVPGFLNMFLLFSIIMDKPPKLILTRDYPPITILTAAYNEEASIAETLKSIQQQDYPAEIDIIVIDDGSVDRTREIISMLTLPNLRLIAANHGGKSAALNLGLEQVATQYVITIDADTHLHPQALTRIVSRITQAPESTAAIAGTIMVKNSRDSLITRLQDWDYALAITSVKRQQALYQGTLVAQGAFSIYKTAALRLVNGWSQTVGEDIVLTWSLLQKGYRTGFEPTALAFTEVPKDLRRFARQRKRWARGMIESFKINFRILFEKYRMVTFLIFLDLLFPVLDFTFSFIFLPGIMLAFGGNFILAGPMTLSILPLTFLISAVMYRHLKNVFGLFNLKIRRNRLGFVLYLLIYQVLLSPVSLWGYTEEFFGKLKRW